jgi:triphosphoribosyl-dephospho-CoA synthase
MDKTKQWGDKMKRADIWELNNQSLTIGSFATQAMLYEVSCMPSPGLVSPVSNGAHKDMNYYTFLDSTSVLSRYMAVFAMEGNSDRGSKEIFDRIRGIGKEAEREMLLATGGINTHKGMLFLMGISCAAAGKAIYDRKSFNDIRNIVKEMTKGIVKKELESLTEEDELSHGERLYIKYQNQGVRGEVESGIPIVFDYSLPLYRKCAHLTKNDQLIHTLIGIISVCNDTTIIHRHNPQILSEVKKRADHIMKLGGMNSICGRENIDHMCNDFLEQNISPGGSADILAVTVFYNLLERYMSLLPTGKVL